MAIQDCELLLPTTINFLLTQDTKETSPVFFQMIDYGSLNFPPGTYTIAPEDLAYWTPAARAVSRFLPSRL
jgi:hypothetical protein